MKDGSGDLQSIYSSARKLPSAARTIDRTMSGLLCVRFRYSFLPGIQL